MAPARKQTTPPNIPPELENYYQKEKRERTGLAWLLAAGTLIVTVLVVMGLFYGGRYLYRKTTNNTKQPAKVATTPKKPATPATPAQPAKPNQSSSSSPNNATSSSQTGTSSTRTNTPSASSSSASATPQSTHLANTGPGDTLAIFAVTAVAGYLLHRRYLARRSTNSDVE